MKRAVKSYHRLLHRRRCQRDPAPPFHLHQPGQQRENEHNSGGAGGSANSALDGRLVEVESEIDSISRLYRTDFNVHNPWDIFTQLRTQLEQVRVCLGQEQRE